MTAFTSSLFAWLLTYLIHSTVLLGLAWLVTRRHRLEPAASDLLWKVRLLAGLVTAAPLAARLAALQRTTGCRRRVHLTMARTISSPVALGLSEICVPELALSELGVEQQRSMLAHELAHLARRDSLWLAGASLIERFFFFQPLNRLARRELETTAEFFSDEWAMRKTGSAGLPRDGVAAGGGGGE